MAEYSNPQVSLIVVKVHSFNNRAITESELLFQGIQFATIEDIAILSYLQTPTDRDTQLIKEVWDLFVCNLFVKNIPKMTIIDVKIKFLLLLFDF
ncbi:hypothetical protein [uncultured Nostoc sp.]|uniref:hypothetical protein n=1 Tax=uncultured Nostoc sp. TaxID=340711 RepID=UPI0035CC7E96